MEEDFNRAVSAKNRIKRVGFYVGLFLAGVVLSAFAREGIDAMKKTANLAAQTASEAWAPNSNLKTIARVPLKTGAPATKSPVPKKIAKPSTPAPAVQSPPPEKEPDLVFAKENKIAADSQSEITAATSSPPSPVPKNNPPPAAEIPPGDGNVPPPVPVPIPPPAPQSGDAHLVIAEIQISGADSTENDFIKFGNPTSANLDISGWKIRKRTKTGTESSIRVIPDGTVIGPGGAILWANSKNNFAANMGAQIISSATISKDNSVAIIDSSGNIVDAVSWGGGTGQFAEGEPYSTNPDNGQILKRKTENGAWKDTDNNSADFFI